MNEVQKAYRKSQYLFDKRKHLLSLSPEKALDAILDEKHAHAIVRSFPEEDLYYLIHDIGAEDALPLLSMASYRQWDYILDMEVWEKDRIHIPALTKWMNMLIEADPHRLMRWALTEKLELMEYFLYRNIHLFIREHDQDPSDFDEDCITLDDVFYVKFQENSLLTQMDPNWQEQRDDFLSEFLERLADADHVTYQNVLFESAHVIPSETEEESYRLRNIRLAEKGFVPFDEAVGVYQRIKPEDFHKGNQKIFFKSKSGNSFLPVPVHAFDLFENDNRFTHALRQIQDHEIIQQLQMEFAGLCNRIISADGKKIRGRNELHYFVNKASGYISIGLECLTEHLPNSALDESVDTIQRHPLIDIFRTGYGLALELKWKAEKWIKASWFDRENLPLSFWDETGMGILGGLLLRKPLYYDPYQKSGSFYREFSTLEDIRHIEKQIEQIVRIDHLLSRMSIGFHSMHQRLLTHKNTMLTLWARSAIGLSDELLPIPLNDFKPFYRHLFSDDSDDQNNGDRVRQAFLDWMARKCDLETSEVEHEVGESIRRLFAQIREEYGKVPVRHLEPKYVELFLLE